MRNKPSNEKSVKAVLSVRGVVFPKTHDLVGLHDLATANGVLIPIPITLCDELNPFAVETRYGILPMIYSASGAMPRDAVLGEIAKVLEWAGKEIGA